MAIIKAEPGWKAVLMLEGNRKSLVDIVNWGMFYDEFKVRFAPLDSIGNDLSLKKNFVFVGHINDPDFGKQAGIV